MTSIPKFTERTPHEIYTCMFLGGGSEFWHWRATESLTGYRRVYADLDTECVLPYDGLFATYNTSTVVHNAPSPSSKPSDKSGIIEKGQSESAFHLKPSKQSKPLGLEIPVSKFGERKAFLGRMGTDDNFEHSIPNAWMGSTPGHPFWVLPLESCAANVGNGARPEMITGPVALYDQVRVYRDEYGQGQGDGRTKMDDHYAKSGWRHLYKQFSGDSSKAVAQSMVVLPFWEVYAYSWHRDGEAFRKLCWVTQATFNAALCKLVLGLEHWGSHSITYWSHSWNEDGHWDDHMDALNSPNKNPGKSGGKYGSEQIGVEEGKRAERKSKKGTVNNQQIGAP